MAVLNNICEKCGHAHLCVFKQNLDKFSNEAKRPLGIDIEIKSCSSFEENE